MGVLAIRGDVPLHVADDHVACSQMSSRRILKPLKLRCEQMYNEDPPFKISLIPNLATLRRPGPTGCVCVLIDSAASTLPQLREVSGLRSLTTRKKSNMLYIGLRIAIFMDLGCLLEFGIFVGRTRASNSRK